jgi:signal transduction histidine kinase
MKKENDVDQRVKLMIKEMGDAESIEEKAEIIFKLLKVYGAAGRYTEVEKHGRTLYEMCKENGMIKRSAEVLYMIAFSRLATSQFYGALEYYLEALPIFKEHFEDAETASVYSEIGRCYQKVRGYEQAIRYYIQAINLNPLKPSYYSNLGSAYLDNGDFTNARKYLSLASHKANEAGDRQTQIFNYANLGNYYFHRKNYKLALHYYRAAREGFKELNLLHFMIKSQIDMGVTEYERGNYEVAEELLFQGSKLSEEMNEMILSSNSFLYMSKVYEKQDDLSTALIYLKKYQELHDRFYKDDLYQKMLDLSIKYEENQRLSRERILLDKASHMASIGVMSAGIAHEINQPLNSIKISADNMLFYEEIHPGSIDEIYVKEISRIAESVQKIEDIINQLSSFWTVDSNTVSENETSLLHATVNEICEMMRSQLMPHGIELRLSFNENDFLIYCPRTQLEQLIINLINNAMQSLETIRQSEKQIEISSGLLARNRCYLSICDNGKGISLDIENRIFEPLFSTKTPHRGSGMGLGLAIVKDILNRIGGKINWENRIQGGVCFLLEFNLKGLKNENITD